MTTQPSATASSPVHLGDDAGGSQPPRDFVSFRARVERLVQSLLRLRHIPDSGTPWRRDAEYVEVKLEADAIKVEFTVALLSWNSARKLGDQFQRTFSGVMTPVLVDFSFLGNMTVHKVREEGNGHRRHTGVNRTTLAFNGHVDSATHQIAITAGTAAFNDHFETFVMEAAKILLPPVERAPTGKPGTSWQKEFGCEFEDLGCHIIRETAIGWPDLAGLADVREQLERAVLTPLFREDLYQRIASAVMPGGLNLLPRGILLSGPPGTGKTWSMRALAGEANLPVITLPCGALLTKWYGESERRLTEVFQLCRNAGRMLLFIDELDALARHRQDSHETTARLVSILLAEMDGLSGCSSALVVGSVNDPGAVDPAVLDRFDVAIAFALPGFKQRQAAFAYYARHLSAEDHADLARRTEGWNFRRIARFAESVVRMYVAGLDLSQLEAREPPLPRLQDYLDVRSALL